MTIDPFKINIPDADVNDLQSRLDNARLESPSPESTWQSGTNPHYLNQFIKEWSAFDWREQEAKLNRLPQFRAEINNCNIHFVHQKSNVSDATPVVLLHGWPDTFHRFHKVIEPLAAGSTDGPGFHVVAPSIPGFGFSDRITMTTDDVADAIAELMTALGYDRFGAVGGDLGGGVALSLARRHQDRLIGIHLTDAGYPMGVEPDFSPAEIEFAQFIEQWWQMEGAYAALQSTKPNTIGAALIDSPVALASWIISFASTGADKDGADVEGAFGGLESLLTNVSIYWFTKTGASSARMYQADAMAKWGGDWSGPTPRAEVPTGFALFPREAPTPREWVNRQAQLEQYSVMATGGHFPPLEVPQLFTTDVRSFFAGRS